MSAQRTSTQRTNAPRPGAQGKTARTSGTKAAPRPGPAQGRVYAPNAESIYEAGVGSDPATLALMGMTFVAMAGAAVQAFESGPAPVLEAPEGPLKSMLAQSAAGDPAAAASSVYAALQGLPIEADVAIEATAPAEPLQDAAAPAPAAQPARFAVQLGAFNSQSAAEAGWRALLADAPPELLKTDITIERVEEAGPNGAVYRLRTGPVGDRAAASAMCERLDRRGVPCVAAAL